MKMAEKKKDKKLKTIAEFLDDFLAKFWNLNTYFKYTISFFSVILLYKFIHQVRKSSKNICWFKLSASTTYNTLLFSIWHKINCKYVIILDYNIEPIIIPLIINVYLINLSYYINTINGIINYKYSFSIKMSYTNDNQWL